MRPGWSTIFCIFACIPIKNWSIFPFCEMAPHGTNSQILICWRHLVWRKRCGHFERRKKDTGFNFLALKNFSLKLSLNNSWLLLFKPLLLARRLKWKNLRNSRQEFPKLLVEKKKLTFFLQRNCSYKLTIIYWKSCLYENKNHLQSEWAFKIYGNSVVVFAISAFIW